MDENLLIEIFRVVNATAFCGLVTLQCNVLRGRMTFVRPSTNHLITESSQAPLWNTKCTMMSCQSFYVTLFSVRLLNQNTSKSGVGHCGSIALGEIGQLVMGSVIDLVRRTVFVSSHPSDQLSQGSRIAFASVISVYIWPK